MKKPIYMLHFVYIYKIEQTSNYITLDQICYHYLVFMNWCIQKTGFVIVDHLTQLEWTFCSCDESIKAEPYQPHWMWPNTLSIYADGHGAMQVSQINLTLLNHIRYPHLRMMYGWLEGRFSSNFGKTLAASNLVSPQPVRTGQSIIWFP